MNFGGDDYKSALPIDENEDFFPELTKEFDTLIKKSKSSASGFENRFVSSATTFLENLAGTALNEIVERVESTYNEWLEVKSALGKVIYTFYKRGLNNISDAIVFNKESAIALQSVIPQLRKIAQVYHIPLKNKNAKTKMTKGSSLLWKIERIQDIIYHFNSAVNPNKYMNYESCLLGAYILASRSLT